MPGKESKPNGLAESLLLGRRRAGLSQDDLARRLGVRRATISDWERGKQFPSGLFLARLEQVLALGLLADVASPEALRTFGQVAERLSDLGNRVGEMAARAMTGKAARSDFDRGRVVGRKEALRDVQEGRLSDLAKRDERAGAEAWQIVRTRKPTRGDVDMSKVMPPPASFSLPTLGLKELGRAAADWKPGSIEGARVAEVKFDRARHYIIEILGNSMRPTICEGDKCIVEIADLYLPPLVEEDAAVDPRPWARLDGEVVVAFINDGDEGIVKRLEVSRKRGTGFRLFLQSDNPHAKAIPIEKEMSLRVRGVVRCIMRSPRSVE